MRPPRIFWIALFVSAGYFIYRWRKQQAEQHEGPLYVGSSAPPSAPPTAPLASTMEASSTPRRIVTRVHKGAPPATPVVPVEPAASEKPTPSLIEVPPAEQGDLVLLGEQQSAPPAVPAEPESVAPAEEPASAASPATAPGLVNVNTADLQALIDLPGIGPALARRIIAYREANGSFTSVDQLIDIQGIGTRNIDEFRHLVTVE